MPADFSQQLLSWFDQEGRHNLPWQHPRSAYRVWISEIMLQQTQVSTVIPYFGRFMDALPDLPALAAATEDQVLGLWSGLGYYRRAKFLHAAAKQCIRKHQGALPDNFEALLALPGIGASTAGAILALAYNRHCAILDGNVKRVLCRYHGIHGYPGKAAVEKELWRLAWEHTPTLRVADYTQAIMDAGATLCTRSKPRCDKCPLKEQCAAFQQGLTDKLPERKPKRRLPHKQWAVLLIINPQGNILLHKRPPTGVWPTLWSLPEAPLEDITQTANQFGKTKCIKRLAPIDHVFSHYKLTMTPVIFHATTETHQIADQSDYRWHSPSASLKLGLPAPIRKLLQNIPTSQQKIGNLQKNCNKT